MNGERLTSANVLIARKLHAHASFDLARARTMLHQLVRRLGYFVPVQSRRSARLFSDSAANLGEYTSADGRKSKPHGRVGSVESLTEKLAARARVTQLNVEVRKSAYQG